MVSPIQLGSLAGVVVPGFVGLGLLGLGLVGVGLEGVVGLVDGVLTEFHPLVIAFNLSRLAG